MDGSVLICTLILEVHNDDGNLYPSDNKHAKPRTTVTSTRSIGLKVDGRHVRCLILIQHFPLIGANNQVRG